MAIEQVLKDLGAATAYAYAVEKGYTGTEAEFAELMASYASVAQSAAASATAAAGSATSAASSASTASAAATTATTKASEASTSATNAAGSASSAASSATAASGSATSAAASATTASGKASEATTAATTATTAKTDAVAAKTAAQTAQTAAETAQGKAETAQEAAEDAAESVSASAAQIATNTSDISDLKEGLTDIGSKQLNFIDTEGGNYYNPNTITNGEYISNSGLVLTATQYAHTALIPVKEGDIVRYTFVSALSDQHSQLYNSSKEWVQSTRWIKTNYTNYQEVTIPSGISYILVNLLATQILSYVITINELYDATLSGTYGYVLSFDDFYQLDLPELATLESAINNISPEQLNFVDVVKNLYDKNTTASGYIGNDGTIYESTSFKYTDYISVNTGNKIRFTYKSDIATQSCQYYSENKNFLITGRYVTTVIDNTYQESIVPANAKYIRINLGSNQANDFVIVKNTAYDASLGGTSDTNISLKDGYVFHYGDEKFIKLNTVDNGLFLKKICCIGDSLTEGQYGVDSVTSQDMGKHDGYPYFLSRMIDCEVENLGIGGMSTKTWWQNKDSHFTPEQLDFSNYDCFIIFLGTNGGLAGNPDATEDSMLGYYCKIIDKCQTESPNSPIFLVGFPWSQNRTESMVSQLEVLSTAEDLPILHLETSEILTYANRLVNQPFDKALHYGRLGYLRLASEIKRCINSVIEANPSDYAELIL